MFFGFLCNAKSCLYFNNKLCISKLVQWKMLRMTVRTASTLTYKQILSSPLKLYGGHLTPSGILASLTLVCFQFPHLHLALLIL